MTNRVRKQLQLLTFFLQNPTPLERYIMSRTALKKKYTFLHLLVDVALTFLTGGLWLIVVVIKYLRTNSN